MSYPIIQTGSLTLPTGSFTMKIQRLNVQQNTPLFAVAGAGDTHAEFVQGIGVEEYIGTGVIQSTAGAYGLSQSSTMTLPSTLDVKAQSWRIRKKWSLVDVTGSGDSSKEYFYGIPNTSLSVAGVAKNGYIADHATASISVTTLLNQFGTVAGTLKLANKVDVVKYVEGGVPLVQFGGEFSTIPTFTPVTSTGTNDDFEWLMDTTTPVEGTLTVDAGDATNLTPNVMIHDVQVSLVPRDGGSMRLTCLMRKTI